MKKFNFSNGLTIKVVGQEETLTEKTLQNLPLWARDCKHYLVTLSSKFGTGQILYHGGSKWKFNEKTVLETLFRDELDFYFDGTEDDIMEDLIEECGYKYREAVKVKNVIIQNGKVMKTILGNTNNFNTIEELESMLEELNKF